MDLKGGWIKVQNVFAKNETNENSMMVKLSTLLDVKNYINIVEKVASDIHAYSGHYVVDGKSLMGILSLSLSSPVKIVLVDGSYKEELSEKLNKIGVLISDKEW